jgi:hypothetical protein
LYDALLVATCRSYRLVSLADTLAIATGHSSLRSATFVRALEFLLDQALDDGFVGIHRLIGDDRGTEAGWEAQAVIAARLMQLGSALDANGVQMKASARTPNVRHLGVPRSDRNHAD